jgi:hypothetical protein
VSLIPQSEHAPHQVQVSDKRQYLMRVGSSFSPVPHGVLAGMFGRAPRPHVRQYYRAQRFHVKNGAVVIFLSLAVANIGRGIARDVFVNLNFSGPEGESKVEVGSAQADVWSHVPAFPGAATLITSEGVRLPPGAIMPALEIRWILHPPFKSAFTVRGFMGASGSAPSAFELVPSLEGLAAKHNESRGNGENHLGPNASPFIRELFGIDAD